MSVGGTLSFEGELEATVKLSTIKNFLNGIQNKEINVYFGL